MNIPRTTAVLRRWSAAFPGIPLPTTTSEIQPTTLLQLQATDPELAQLLNPQGCPPELELAVREGRFADTTATPQQRHDANTAARIAELVAMNPYAPGQQNLTLQLELQSLDPAAAAKLQAAAAPKPAPMPEGDRRAFLAHGYAVPAR